MMGDPSSDPALFQMVDLESLVPEGCKGPPSAPVSVVFGLIIGDRIDP